MNTFADAVQHVVIFAAAGYGTGIAFVVVLLIIGNKGRN